MKKIFTIALFMLGAVAITFAANEETRNLGNFSTLATSSGVKVILVKGSSNKAKIETVNADTDEIITVVKGDELQIKWKSNKGSWKNRKGKVILTYKNIEGISVSSGSMVKSDDVLESRDLFMNVSSGGLCNLEISTNEIRINVSSGGNLTLEGQADESDVDVSSGGYLNAVDLKSDHSKVNSSSGGAAKVWVEKSIRASANSGGMVKYKGNPENTNINSGFSGSVKKM
ncbi:MAG: head GIN domain-containing protein [Bacteroidota bacterium]